MIQSAQRLEAHATVQIQGVQVLGLHQRFNLGNANIVAQIQKGERRGYWQAGQLIVIDATIHQTQGLGGTQFQQFKPVPTADALKAQRLGFKKPVVLSRIGHGRAVPNEQRTWRAFSLHLRQFLYPPQRGKMQAFQARNLSDRVQTFDGKAIKQQVTQRGFASEV